MAYAGADKEMARVRQKVMDPEFKRIMSAVEEIAQARRLRPDPATRAALYFADRIDITPDGDPTLDKAGTDKVQNGDDPDAVGSRRRARRPSRPRPGPVPPRRPRPRIPGNND